MDIIKVFGTNVKHYRQQTGLSQEAFAEKCGMHRTYISAIECFRRSISLENIQRIADALGVEAYRLLLENQEDTENDTVSHIGSSNNRSAGQALRHNSRQHHGRMPVPRPPFPRCL